MKKIIINIIFLLYIFSISVTGITTEEQLIIEDRATNLTNSQYAENLKDMYMGLLINDATRIEDNLTSLDDLLKDNILRVGVFHKYLLDDDYESFTDNFPEFSVMYRELQSLSSDLNYIADRGSVTIPQSYYDYYDLLTESYDYIKSVDRAVLNSKYDIDEEGMFTEAGVPNAMFMNLFIATSIAEPFVDKMTNNDILKYTPDSEELLNLANNFLPIHYIDEGNPMGSYMTENLYTTKIATLNDLMNAYRNGTDAVFLVPYEDGTNSRGILFSGEKSVTYEGIYGTEKTSKSGVFENIVVWNLLANYSNKDTLSETMPIYVDALGNILDYTGRIVIPAYANPNYYTSDYKMLSRAFLNSYPKKQDYVDTTFRDRALSFLGEAISGKESDNTRSARILKGNDGNWKYADLTNINDRVVNLKLWVKGDSVHITGLQTSLPIESDDTIMKELSDFGDYLAIDTPDIREGLSSYSIDTVYQQNESVIIDLNRRYFFETDEDGMIDYNGEVKYEQLNTPLLFDIYQHVTLEEKGLTELNKELAGQMDVEYLLTGPVEVFSGYVNDLMNNFRGIRNVVGIPSYASNQLTSTIMSNYYIIIFIIFAITSLALIFRYFVGNLKLYGTIASIVIIGLYMFVGFRLLPEVTIEFANATSYIFAEDFGWDVVLMESERDYKTYESHFDSYTDTNLKNKQGSFDSLTLDLYKFDLDTMAQLVDQQKIRDPNQNYYSQDKLYTQDGMTFIQDEYMRVDLTDVWDSHEISGDYTEDSYQLVINEVYPEGTVYEYYMAYEQMMNNLVSELNQFSSIVTPPRRTFTYSDGIERDSFMVKSYFSSAVFWYESDKEALSQFLDSAYGVTLDNSLEIDLNSQDILGVREMLENDRDQGSGWKISAYDKGVIENPDEIVTMINTSVVGFIYSIYDRMPYISDENLIKAISLYGAMELNKNLSSVGSYVYPNRLNIEEVTYAQLIEVLLTTPGVRFSRDTSDIVYEVASTTGLFGVILFSISSISILILGLFVSSLIPVSNLLLIIFLCYRIITSRSLGELAKGYIRLVLFGLSMNVIYIGIISVLTGSVFGGNLMVRLLAVTLMSSIAIFLLQLYVRSLMANVTAFGSANIKIKQYADKVFDRIPKPAKRTKKVNKGNKKSKYNKDNYSERVYD